jgi:hypothetical protein
MSQDYQEKSVQPHPSAKKRRFCLTKGHKVQGRQIWAWGTNVIAPGIFQCPGDCGKVYCNYVFFPRKIHRSPPPLPPPSFQAVVIQHIGLQWSGFPQVAKCKAQ